MAEQKEKANKTEHGNLSEIARNSLVPPVDIFEGSENVTLIADLPGTGKDDLELQIDGDTLQILGKTKKSSDPHLIKHYTEFPEKNFYRAFTIGEEIDKDNIAATMNNGVLKLILPKSEKIRPKKIEIKF